MQKYMSPFLKVTKKQISGGFWVCSAGRFKAALLITPAFCRAFIKTVGVFLKPHQSKPYS